MFTDPKQTEQSEKYEPCGKERECVPKFLCKNDEIITDGAGIIDIRKGGGALVTNGRKKRQISAKNPTSEDTECGYLNKCCNLPIRVSESFNFLESNNQFSII